MGITIVRLERNNSVGFEPAGLKCSVDIMKVQAQQEIEPHTTELKTILSGTIQIL